MLRKKVLSALLVVSLMAGTLIGCGNQDSSQEGSAQESQQTGGGEKETEETGTETGETEVEGEKKLTILTVAASAPFPDDASINSNQFIDMIREETGYEIDWQLFKQGEDIYQQLNLLLSSGAAPDLIQLQGNLMPIYELAEKGGLAELDEAYEKYGDYLKETYSEEVVDMLRYDGKLYGLPRYTGGAPVGTWAIRKDWLDELKLEEPKTREDLYNVLVAMKEAHPDIIPLAINGLTGMLPIMGSFGIYGSNSDYGIEFAVEDGKVTVPMLDERGVEFIKYMNRLYDEGLIDPEFPTMGGEALQKMLGGQAGLMFMDYVTICRNMASFQENNPEGELCYIDCTVGDNGEQGYMCQGLLSQVFVVPITSADKADLCVDFLNKCNASEKIVNTISLGFEGQSYTMEGDTYVKTENAADYSYKGYYSRVILSSVFDDLNAVMEGYDGYMETSDQYKKINDIRYAPMGVPASSDKISVIKSDISTAVITMIVNGYTEEAFEDMKARFVQNGGEQVLAEYQEWVDAR